MIYFLRAHGMPIVKVGFTEGPLRDTKRMLVRFSQIAPHSPIPLLVVGVRDGDLLDEQELHRRIAARRAHNEWFILSDEEVNEIVETGGCVAAEQETRDLCGTWWEAAEKAVRSCHAKMLEKRGLVHDGWSQCWLDKRDKSLHAAWDSGAGYMCTLFVYAYYPSFIRLDFNRRDVTIKDAGREARWLSGRIRPFQSLEKPRAKDFRRAGGHAYPILDKIKIANEDSRERCDRPFKLSVAPHEVWRAIEWVMFGRRADESAPFDLASNHDPESWVSYGYFTSRDADANATALEKARRAAEREAQAAREARLIRSQEAVQRAALQSIGGVR